MQSFFFYIKTYFLLINYTLCIQFAIWSLENGTNRKLFIEMLIVLLKLVDTKTGNRQIKILARRFKSVQIYQTKPNQTPTICNVYCIEIKICS